MEVDRTDADRRVRPPRAVQDGLEVVILRTEWAQEGRSGRRCRRVVSSLGVTLLVAAGMLGVDLGAGVAPVAAQSNVTVSTNISYGPSTLDAFVPKSVSGPTPAVIYVHGGAFSGGDKVGLDPVAQAVAQVGWAGFSVNFRLNGYPTSAEDVLSAIMWVRANASRFNIDPNRIAVLGTSSGAAIALEAVMDASQMGGSAAGVVAVASWSGQLDFTALANNPEPGDWVLNALQWYVGCSVTACPSYYVADSPITYASGTNPPFFLANSSNEVIPVSEPDNFAAAVQAAGGTAQELIIPGNLHGIAYEPDALQPTVNFFSNYLGPTTGPVPIIQPLLSGVSGPAPYVGQVGDFLTLNGGWFDPTSVITSDPGITVTQGQWTYTSQQALTFSVTVAPTVTPGGHSVTVTNPDGGVAKCNLCLNVTAAPAPTVASTTAPPLSPPLTGSTPVTFNVTGTGFTSQATVSFSNPGLTVTSVSDRNSTQLSVSASLAAGSASGPVSLVLTTAGGSATCSGCLTVNPGPTVTSMTPLVRGTTTVATVTGTGFEAGLTLKSTVPGATFGAPTAVTATSFQVAVTVPSSTAAGWYWLRVTNPDQGFFNFTQLQVH